MWTEIKALAAAAVQLALNETLWLRPDWFSASNFSAEAPSQLSVPSIHDHAVACEALYSKLAIDNTTILRATYHSTPTTLNDTVQGRGCFESVTEVSVPLCRVEFKITTSPDSELRAEAWLPDEWYGRFMGLGNGGLGGCEFSTDYIITCGF